MYIIDGIAYAGERAKPLRVCGIRPLEQHRIWLRFTNGEAKVFDFTSLLDTPAFAPLRDEAVFRDVYIDYGVPEWDNGNIDLDPTYLYEHSIPVDEAESA